MVLSERNMATLLPDGNGRIIGCNARDDREYDEHLENAGVDRRCWNKHAVVYRHLQQRRASQSVAIIIL